MLQERRLDTWSARLERLERGHEHALGKFGSREWDRTTDHLHVKEVLYH